LKKKNCPEQVVERDKLGQKEKNKKRKTKKKNPPEGGQKTKGNSEKKGRDVYLPERSDPNKKKNSNPKVYKIGLFLKSKGGSISTNKSASKEVTNLCRGAL